MKNLENGAEIENVEKKFFSPHMSYLSAAMTVNEPMPVQVIKTEAINSLPEVTGQDILGGLKLIVSAVQSGRHWAAYNGLDAYGMCQVLGGAMGEKQSALFLNELYLKAKRVIKPRNEHGFEAIDILIKQQRIKPVTTEVTIAKIVAAAENIFGAELANEILGDKIK